MKKTKRILTVLLTLALGLTLLVPVAAAGTSDPYAPIITKEPKSPMDVYVGDTITLEIGAKVPDGIDGELSYVWKYAGEVLGTEPKLDLVITEAMGKNTFTYIWVYVTNTYTDENGEMQTNTVSRSPSFHAKQPLQWWEIPLAIISAPLWIPLLPGMLIFGLGGGIFAIPVALLGGINWLLQLIGIDLFSL